ncbi:MAG TPA: ASCH domain-containing protein [Rhizomicrobium sp.]
MKALSIQQPWAWAILTLGKDIENRDWQIVNPGLTFRGPVLIHTGKRIDPDGVEYLRTCGHPPPENLPLGGIVGEMEIVDLVTRSASPWFFGPYGFVLKNAKPLKFTPLRGQLGFFSVPDEILAAARGGAA